MVDAKPSRLAVAAWALVVFVLAVLLRLPSCYESFWLDELHTAWAIWGELGDVAPRAEVGNQTPLYFQLMWVWKQVVGDSEVALRLSSVLAVAAASALLVLAVTHTTRQLAAGVLAGLLLAVESNSLFFGTEFRPYAWLMLLSVIATWAAVALLQESASIRPANLRLILLTAVGVAAVLHPTALVTLGILAGTALSLSFVMWLLTTGETWNFHFSDIASLIVIIAVALTLWDSSLSDSWQRRDQWRAFGHATRIGQLWAIWPWAILVLLPSTLGIGFLLRSGGQKLGALLPLFAAIVATATFFWASYNDWVPLWHRRYFIAVLPMLAWSCGVWVMISCPVAPTSRSQNLAITLAVPFVLLLMSQQGTLQQLTSGNTKLVHRGEDWRRAIEFVNQHRGDEEVVLLDPGLIETRVLDRSFQVDEALSKIEWRYFQFPVKGPYFVPDVDVETPTMNPTRRGPYRFKRMRLAIDSSSRWSLWMISRSSQTALQRWAESHQDGLVHRSKIRRFGSISVVQLYSATLAEYKAFLGKE